MEGILAVWKPAGWTSHDVVAKVRRLLRIKRIGHAGTLDPQVTGVLPICIGRATRVVEYVQERPKAYEAVLQLGLSTDTEDLTGTILSQVDSVTIQETEIRRALASFVGEIEQVPPMYSAVRVSGKRLYELAREGRVIERQARPVTIYELELLGMELDIPHPRIRFSVKCSKGTYIRTLCVDIGKALGVPAVMAELTRTMSGGFTRQHCLTLDEIETLQASGELEAKLLPADAALDHLPRAAVDARMALHAFQGKQIPLDNVQHLQPFELHALIRLYEENGMFLGLFQVDADTGMLKAVKVFTPTENK
ncbi:tRNA pseudouridine(55) synthase TruB [Paenibacillus sp. sptzw28]|uniref:tRNA pseudouridine(55) synthase TruB n=1 Tax=Paenibacillus sp. sptzw28 TaxID=715179 RepID=UPI001C6F5B78|nr:tRNA pseudouridine(55) synthase TruB [Paenibacillus sp. sptzw28]QYR24172.1 tRNA pseudouridine(55) synthase TruB [Paenibacillus sp. sptzw28]